MARKKRYSYYSLNIKRNGIEEKERTKKYKELLNKLHEKKTSINVWSDKYVYLRRLFDQGDFMYGVFSVFTNIEGDWLDFETGDIAKVKLPDNVFPNWKDCEFYFFPSEHKMAIHYGGSISLNLIVKFLRGAFEFHFPNELITVDIIQSAGIYEKIVEAKEVRRLEINITYTNDDLMKEFGEYIDDELKKSKIHELNLIAKPDKDRNIDINNRLIGGSLELAQANGHAKATIINSEGKRELIKTYKHPSVETAESENDHPNDIGRSIWDKFIHLFRSN